MSSIENKCFTKKLYNLGKTRVINHKNKTKKKIKKLLTEHPYKYFNTKELYDLKCNINDTISIKFNENPGKLNLSKKDETLIQNKKKEIISKLGIQNIKKMINEISKQSINSKHYLEYNNDYYIYKKMGHQYKNYFLKKNCNDYDLLNIDKLSKGFDFFNIQNIEYNPSSSKISFCVDFVGNRNFYFFIKDLINNTIEHIDLNMNKHERFVSVHDLLNDASNYSSIQMADSYFWIDNESILYISYDSYFNTNKCYVYNTYTHKRRLIYSDKNHRMLGLSSTTSNYYFILYSSSYTDDEVYILDINEDKINSKHKKILFNPKPVFHSKPYVKYCYLDHIDGTWYVLKKNKFNYYFYKSSNLIAFELLLHYSNPYQNIKSVIHVLNNFVFIIQIKGTYKIEIYNICKNKIIQKIDQNQGLCLDPKSCYLEPYLPYPVLINENQLIFQNTSFTKYGKVFSLKFDIENNITFNELKVNQKKIQKYNNLCNEKTYFLKNKNIMFSIIYKKGTSLKNRKCIVYGYGSYGAMYESSYNFNKFITICLHGYIAVITHISGDGKLGFNQRYNGMLDNKKNSFDDFIYICDYLVQNKITTRDKMAIWGRSAGGLLISSVLNKRPDICKLAIMGVPFLTPLISMNNSKMPLGYESHSEWGDPRDKKMDDYIKSYSPIDNIKPCGKYPNIFIYANINDTLTPYKETMMYYNLMKDVEVYKNKEKELLLFIDDKFGHKQGTKYNDHNYVFSLVFNMLLKFI